MGRCKKDRFAPIVFDPELDQESLLSMRLGLTPETVRSRTAEYGPNSLDTNPPNLLRVIITQVVHPFYLFQVFSFVLWMLDDYKFYACTILLISTISVVIQTVQTRTNQLKLYRMARHTGTSTVLRRTSAGLECSSIDIQQIVPGDVVQLTDDQPVPADLIITTGDVIADESMLTGEATPTLKTPLILEPGDTVKASAVPPLHVLYTGTRVIQTRTVSGHAYGIVTRTGFATAKGGMIRSIINPPAKDAFSFYSDSIKFLLVMCILAGVGFLFSVFFFIRLHVPIKEVILRGLDIITVVVPPALPACMTVGTSFAISFLKGKNIFCMQPHAINIAGKIKIAVFDKTGTITRSKLILAGVINGASPIVAPPSSSMTVAMGCCHTLSIHEGRVIGDVLERMMFKATGGVISTTQKRQWEDRDDTDGSDIDTNTNTNTTTCPPSVATVHRPPSALAVPVLSMPGTPLPDVRLPGYSLDVGGVHFLGEVVIRGTVNIPAGNNSNTAQEVHILHRYSFESSLQRMSVIVAQSEGLYVYCKGSPERIITHCDPASIPTTLPSTLARYASQGMRVIAVASKPLSCTAPQAVSMARADVEMCLTFLGLVLFTNPVRHDSAAAIADLHAAGIRAVICTGDNPHTAVAVAKDVGILTHDPIYIVPDDTAASPTGVQILDTPDRASATRVIDPDSLLHIADGTVYNKFCGSGRPYPNPMVIVGDAFERVVAHCGLPAPPRPTIDLLDLVVTRAAVLARMRPDTKAAFIRAAQARTGLGTMMVGDGANDCNSLRAADVGVALSQAEASIAAPFTAQKHTISAAVDVTAHGRCALMTSFQAFKYMAIYSMIQFISVVSLYRIDSNLSDGMYLVIDLFTILPLAFAMSRAKPTPKPGRRTPPSKLVGGTVLSALLGQVALALVFQVGIQVYVTSRPWYIPLEADVNGLNVTCMLTTTVFSISIAQYIATSVAFSIGRPFRRPMWDNYVYVAIALVISIMIAGMVIISPPLLRHIMQMAPMPLEFRLVLAGAIVAFTTLSVGWEALSMHVRLYSRVKRRVLPRRVLVGIKQRHRRVRLIEAELDRRWWAHTDNLLY